MGFVCPPHLHPPLPLPRLFCTLLQHRYSTCPHPAAFSLHAYLFFFCFFSSPHLPHLLHAFSFVQQLVKIMMCRGRQEVIIIIVLVFVCHESGSEREDFLVQPHFSPQTFLGFGFDQTRNVRALAHAHARSSLTCLRACMPSVSPPAPAY